MKIIFNEQVALEVFNVLGKAWRKKEGIFRDIVLPQDRYPAIDNPREYANWLFYSALTMRGGIVSEDPFKWLWEMRQKFPDVFEPEMVVKNWTAERIEQAIKAIIFNKYSNGNEGEQSEDKKRGYKIDEHARHWYANSVALFRYWDSNVLNVFWGVTEFEEAFRRIDYYNKNEVGFRGMRRKIFSLLVVWLQNKGLINVFPAPIPIDFHALRILWATNIIKPKKVKKLPYNERYLHLEGKMAIAVTEPLVDSIHIWSQKFLVQHSFSHREINQAIWVLGRGLCSQHLQNSSRRDGTILFDAENVEENHNLWPSHYTNPCAICPIEKFCEAAFPAAPYYRFGLLVRLKRVPFPQFSLPGVNWSTVGRTAKRNKRK